jgi:TRAP-type C4-dicarboxylate transport system permease small subunit
MASWRSLAAKLCAALAGVFLAGMMLLTVSDVVLRSFFNIPIRGTFELIELFLAGTVFLGLPAVFLRDEHIVVDIVDYVVPRAITPLRRIAEMIAVAIIAAMSWQALKAAQDAMQFGDTTADLEIPKILYWIPVLVGLIGGGIAAAAMAIRPGVER